MSIEGSKLPPNEKNQLPLPIQDSELLAQSGESNVWRAEVRSPAQAETQEIALKQNRKEAFATDEEMQHSKSYYEFLKNFPGFGKFVPDTLYFKARMQEGAAAQSFCIQKLLPGKTVNRLTDAELQQDPEVTRQLTEFIDATIEILHATRAEGAVKPDFGKSADDDEYGTYMANSLLNPRYSNNIFITDTPDERGQRVFFIDTGENVAERTKKVWRVFQRQVVGRIQESRLKEWRAKLKTETRPIENT